MKFSEYFDYGFRNLRKAKIRTWLTMLGIFIGIAAVVSLISLGIGMKEAINYQLSSLGADKLIISPKGGFGGIGAAVSLTEDDLNIVKKTSGIKLAAGLSYKPAKIKSRTQIKYVNLMGLSPDEAGELVRELSNYKVIEGRDLKDGDIYKAVLGYNFLSDKKVFDKKLDIGEKILINDREFRIIGFLNKIGNSQDDSSIIISKEAYKTLYDTGNNLNMIFAKTAAGEDPKKVADAVRKKLRQYRGLEKGKEDFLVETSDTFFESFGVILTIVQIVLIGIASISLIVGGIGIMNTMYTSVIERTREIGVMKAIGAKNSDIFLLFFIESGLIGIVGGVIGALLGIGLAKLVELIASNFAGAFIKAYLSPWLIVGAILFSFIVGSLSGALPARQASKLKPVDALRYE